jgi:hypothetical protein
MAATDIPFPALTASAFLPRLVDLSGLLKAQR